MGITFSELKDELDAKRKFKEANPNLHKFEKAVMDKFVGSGVDTVVKKVGFRKVRWMPCVNISLGLLVVLNLLASFDRDD